MKEKEPNFYARLGVKEDASFEEIKFARDRLKEKYSNDGKTVESIEGAYDAILMERLRMRQEGKIKVPDGIRFAEKNTPLLPNFNPLPAGSSGGQLIGLPSVREFLSSSLIFLGLIGFIFLGGTSETQLPFALAFGVGFALFWINRKQGKLWRSLMIVAAGFFLAVGLIYLGGIFAPIVLTAKWGSLIIFVMLWLVSTFFR
ncbi:MAG TPA: CPP1-like family protein [Allocoleopsis sp.]